MRRAASIMIIALGEASTTSSKRSWARLRSVMSMMAASVHRPSAVSMGLRPISIGTSSPFLRRPKRSRPAPMARVSGRVKKSSTWRGWPSRKRVGISVSTVAPSRSSRA